MLKFLDDKVPEEWEKNAYPSLKPLKSWVLDLIVRIEFFSKWLYEGPPNSFWLSAFFFPQGFLTAALQQYARKTTTPIDALQFRACVRDYFEDDVRDVPDDGVNIHGLFLQGAKWSMARGCVEDSDPKVILVKFPVIWLEPVDSHENLEQGCYMCPLYKTSTRRGELSTTGHSTNFVRYMDISTEAPADDWTRRGVALLCMTDD